MTVRAGRLLRAAIALSGKTLEEIALVAAIRDARLRSIHCGRAAPEESEFEAILRACGLRESLLTRLYPGGRRSRLDAILFGLLLEQEEGSLIDHRSAALQETVHIDKFSLSFDAKSDRSIRSWLLDCGPRFRSKRPYYEREHRCGAIIVQHGALRWGPTRRRTSRVAFNPSRLDRSDRTVIADVLGLARRDSLCVTRVDVAVDLPVDIREIQALGTERRTAHLVITRRGTTTRYAGRRSSDGQSKIYDKKEELRSKGVTALPAGPLTRFEAEVRRPGLGPWDLGSLKNPFTQLRMVRLDPLDAPLSMRLAVQYARAFGLQALRAVTEPKEFKQLSAEIEQHLGTRDFHPADSFDRHWAKAAAKTMRLFTKKSGRR